MAHDVPGDWFNGPFLKKKILGYGNEFGSKN